MSEYDRKTYRPKYHEDLVHSEISLPPNAPKEYADRATLWNAVELSEKRAEITACENVKSITPQRMELRTCGGSCEGLRSAEFC